MKVPITIFVILAAIILLAQPMPTNVVRQLPPPQSPRAIAEINLTWQPYTNVQILILGSTNLIDWYFKTNVPVWRTNVVIPIGNQAEYYRFTNCVLIQ